MLKKIILGIIVIALLCFVGCGYIKKNIIDPTMLNIIKSQKGKNHPRIEKIRNNIQSTSEAGCARNEAVNCWGAALFYSTDIYIEPNLQKAEYFANKSCELNYFNGCFELSSIYVKTGKIQQGLQTLAKTCQMPIPNDYQDDKKFRNFKDKVCTPDIIRKMQQADEKTLIDVKNLIQQLINQ